MLRKGKFSAKPAEDSGARRDAHSNLEHQRRGYLEMTGRFSAGLLRIVSASKFKCAVTISGGRCLIQLFNENSTNSLAANIIQFTPFNKYSSVSKSGSPKTKNPFGTHEVLQAMGIRAFAIPTWIFHQHLQTSRKVRTVSRLEIGCT
jgi:hypothetical protein